jgi:hypothetical protein
MQIWMMIPAIHRRIERKHAAGGVLAAMCEAAPSCRLMKRDGLPCLGAQHDPARPADALRRHAVVSLWDVL